MKKTNISNKQGIFLTEILVAMVLVVIVIVGGFQAVKSWKDSAKQHNTVQALIAHIPSALDQVILNKTIEPYQVKLADMVAVTNAAEKDGFGNSFTICSVASAKSTFCIQSTFATGEEYHTNVLAALAGSTGTQQAISSAAITGTTLQVKYVR